MPDLGPSIAPCKFKNEQKLPKIVDIIANFLVLYFGENFIKTRTKLPKLQMHVNVNENMFFIHIFMQIFMSFYDGQLKQQIYYSFTLLISYMVFNTFKMVVQFF